MENSTSQTGEILHSQSGRTVVRVDNNLVIKSGHLRNQEVETLQFIAKHTTIPYMIFAGRVIVLNPLLWITCPGSDLTTHGRL
ncbi:uncharacterized protein N7483_002865 [Penicillium malachiteum]|uniref:uncharacterized protein n=1 Tax=Penicillium malachiteum TaxID=1324776 RepID=UPI002546DBB9|nr:uncharacterized protein N7483_002865 [Penicillium malachiteum]KAJ5737740.1 hypothetical protein N7483_002865 [Penicillium malachiteum]